MDQGNRSISQSVKEQVRRLVSKEPEYRSFVDHVLSLAIRGWATVDREGGQRVTITRGGTRVATLVADLSRPDLPQFGLEANAGFEHRFDPPLLEGEEICALFESGRHLEGSPTIFHQNPWGSLKGLDPEVVRCRVAASFLHGAGIEVGALHRPLSIPSEVKVTYVDRQSRKDLLLHYPELANLPIVEPDVIDDGEKLEKIEGASQDFVIASHFIEHCEDPVGTIKTYCRVLRPGGVIFLVVPDREAFFDRDRPLTTVEHLIQDHELGTQYSRKAHYMEWAELVDKRSGEQVYIHARELDLAKYSIHFHVWTAETFLECFSAVSRRYQLPLHMLVALKNNGELIAVYRRN